MKRTAQKQSFCGDFSIIKSIGSTPLSSISKHLIVFLFVISSTFLLNYNAFSIELINQKVPVKKANSVATKNIPSKIVKGKEKGKKIKKSVVIKKDTLKDIDPASASSPLYDN